MSDVTIAAKGGALYAAIVFGVGFALGAFRVLLVVPRLGETVAVILETPVMLVASWYVCRWCVKRLDVPHIVLTRSVMGVGAFVVLMVEELALGLLVLGRPPAEYFGAYRTAAGGIGLAAQIMFALVPVIQVWRRYR